MSPFSNESVRVLCWMGLPVVAGYALWRVMALRLPAAERRAGALARLLGAFAIVGVATPLMLITVWVARFPAGTAIALPLIGLLVHVAGTAAGWAAARALGRPPASVASLLLAGGCSNVLAFGGITVVLLLRSPADPDAEAALAAMAVYRFLESPYYFLVAWPLAAAIGGSGAVTGAGTHEPAGRIWRSALRGAFRATTLAPALGLLAGAALNGLGAERPAALDGVAEVLVRVIVVLMGLTVGLGLRSAAPLRHWRPCLIVTAIKFALMPAVGVGAALALGLDGVAVQVIAICSAMPVAFTAVVGAALHRLDEELAASLWLFTTAAMVVVIPLLGVAVPRLGGA